MTGVAAAVPFSSSCQTSYQSYGTLVEAAPLRWLQRHLQYVLASPRSTFDGGYLANQVPNSARDERFWLKKWRRNAAQLKSTQKEAFTRID